VTLLKIARLGHPVLLRVAAPVDDPAGPERQRLFDAMVATMRDAGGIGLAAPQVHVGERILVAVPLRARDETPPPEPIVLVNPELTELDRAEETDFEGCLSIPGLRGLVPRRRRIGWRGLDRAGRAVEGEAEGLFARVLQHEVDHLDGVLYLMRMSDLRGLAFTSELHRLQRHLAGEPDEPG
jgi:peptide deformylase